MEWYYNVNTKILSLKPEDNRTLNGILNSDSKYSVKATILGTGILISSSRNFIQIRVFCSSFFSLIYKNLKITYFNTFGIRAAGSNRNITLSGLSVANIGLDAIRFGSGKF